MAQYRPGSIFKIAQAMTALQEGVITPETRWRMDAIAVIGNRIVCRSRLTGLCFFTFLTMNNAHMLFLLFPSSGLLAGQTASFL